MNSDELPVGLKKDQFQESASTRDRSARSKTEVSTTNLIVESLVAALLLGETRSGDFRHAVDRGDRTRINGSFERDPEGVTDCRSPLLHRN